MAHREFSTCNLSRSNASFDPSIELDFKKSEPKIVAYFQHIGHESSHESSGLDVPPNFEHVIPTNIPQHANPMMVEAHSRYQEASFIDEN